jgi:hypothetical protein
MPEGLKLLFGRRKKIRNLLAKTACHLPPPPPPPPLEWGARDGEPGKRRGGMGG